jgi:hypothetical protein
MSATPVEYRVTTAPWRDAMADRKGGCDFQLLARVNGRGPTRARIDTVEQILDDSWSPRHRIPEGKRATIRVEFIEPYGPEHGYTLADRTVTFTCRRRDNRPRFTGNADLSGVP